MIRVELGGEVDNNIGLFKRYFISKLIILIFIQNFIMMIDNNLLRQSV